MWLLVSVRGWALSEESRAAARAAGAAMTSEEAIASALEE